ncbi:hypothetical protein TPHV1_50051 [Treponema phagedenis]|uniref:Uncharacterized protein n=1 Tax=Treponema phagedenis TaxID=162 RepID=A0A0B7H1E8_TREPH|nr:hypothetical protein [Treponema phagedenis]CEM62791.1 hypothetical protein TPHV1_50051 [Treponema phagedenis]
MKKSTIFAYIFYTCENADGKKSQSGFVDFYASEPDTLYFTDITEVPCADGKLYICPMFDACGGEIVSLAMDSNMKKSCAYEH